ncbi:MAG: hypothetical protein JXA46_17425 [Dehalococcoidales bacterium]|nr:hypothetical protein [Dehalococcoidales bacterium]
MVLLLAIAAILTACAGPAGSQAAGPENETWLSPGKIRIDNLSPGNSVKHDIQVHNGEEVERAFSVYYRVPDYLEDSFFSAPAGAREWTAISEESPLIGARETKEIEVILNLPDDVQPPERWEFWIGVRKNSSDSLSAELCSRWLVSMKGQ